MNTIIDIIFFLFIGVCIYTDAVYRKIYNFTVFPAVILGIGLNFMYFGLSGLKESLLGIVVGFLFLILFYLLGGIGAGDVKFMMAVGSIKGYNFVFFGGLYGAVIAGIASVFVLLLRRRFLNTIKEILSRIFSFAISKNKDSLRFQDNEPIHLPYSVFLSIGMLLKYLEIYY